MVSVARKPSRVRRYLRITWYRRRRSILLAFGLLILIWFLSFFLPSKPLKIQYQFKSSTSDILSFQNDQNIEQTRAAAVRDEFQWAYNKYHSIAWGKDEITPVTGGFKTTRNGWGATLIDSLTTAMIMNVTTEVKWAVDYVVNDLDFDHYIDELVDPFETIIRYLGALVSAVDIIDSGAVPYISKKARNAILNKAVHLSRLLGPAYDSPQGILWPRVNLSSGIGSHEADVDGVVSMSRELPFPTDPARTGSNWLENYRLGMLTGDPVYHNNATRAWASLVWNRNEETFDGLIDSPIDSFSGFSLSKSVSLGAGHDSYYEYLIKAAILAPRDKYSSKYSKRWEQAMISTKANLAFRGTVPESYGTDGERHTKGYLFIARYYESTYLNEMGHLTCFIAGNLILGGKYLDKPELIKFGLDILETCHATYLTVTGLGPESFVWEPKRSDYDSEIVDGENEQVRWAITAPGSHEQEQTRKLGFWISDARYMLRPEVVEGYFYAYRITGDPIYREWAWSAFQSITKYSKTKYGFGEVNDVSLPSAGGEVVDQSESFFLAETLKYLYLIFDDATTWSLDDWVFSTEGHPFARS
ncbi:glycoside hydrolase [Lipomyces japonicus]|uniref:glycoside hydrolase n=1 Tax=Lipomyces japonicus TaxID=56871 RepID=UPI0034CE57B9